MDSTATGRPRVCILWRGGVSCPVSAAWHSCVAAHWLKYHCYKQAPSWYDLKCFKATLNPKQNNDKKRTVYPQSSSKELKWFIIQPVTSESVNLCGNNFNMATMPLKASKVLMQLWFWMQNHDRIRHHISASKLDLAVFPIITLFILAELKNLTLFILFSVKYFKNTIL